MCSTSSTFRAVAKGFLRSLVTETLPFLLKPRKVMSTNSWSLAFTESGESTFRSKAVASSAASLAAHPRGKAGPKAFSLCSSLASPLATAARTRAALAASAAMRAAMACSAAETTELKSCLNARCLILTMHCIPSSLSVAFLIWSSNRVVNSDRMSSQPLCLHTLIVKAMSVSEALSSSRVVRLWARCCSMCNKFSSLIASLNSSR
mmetsp:Transcript_130724/g.419239  ORF Transcript_130724/g.419239 Transcript_130724/m.419239 type:complete len:206 (+) Transcript_130724:519-1136(+)